MPTPDTPTPELTLPLISGGHWHLSQQAPAAFTMILAYRGLHCPLCKAYLQELKEHLPGYIDAGFNVIAVSMDTREKAQKSYDDWGLGDIPIGYGMTEAQARAWGLYLSESIKDSEPGVFSEPGLFWVRPDGRLFLADVSNLPFARPDLGALLGKVDFILSNDYPARGARAA